MQEEANQNEQLPHALCASMWREDPERHSMPVAGHQREGALPDARWQINWQTKDSRSLYSGGNSGKAKVARDTEGTERNHPKVRLDLIS